MYFRVRSDPDYGILSHRRLDDMDQGRGARPGSGAPRAQAQDPAGLRPVEGAQAGRGHLVGVPLGAGPAGLAHRVLGDGRGRARRRLRHPRRRLGPGVSPPRERGRPDPRRPRAGAGADLDAQRHDPVHRREDGQVGRQHRAVARGASSATAATPSSCTWPRATTASRWPSRPRSSRTPTAAFSASATRSGGWTRASPARRTWPTTRRRSSTPWPRTSTRPGRSRRCSSGCARPTGRPARPAMPAGPGGSTGSVGDADLREMLSVLGLGELTALESVGDVASIDPEAVALLEQRERARAERDFQTADGLRDELRARGLGDPRRTRRRRADLRRASRCVILYGRNAVREALRGRRAKSVGEVWATPGRRARAVACGREREDAARPRTSSAAAARPRIRGCAPRRGAIRTCPPSSCWPAPSRWWWRWTRCRTRRTSARSAAPPSAPGAAAW